MTATSLVVPAALLLLAMPRTVVAGRIVFTGVVVNDGSCTPYVDCVVDPSRPNDHDPAPKDSLPSRSLWMARLRSPAVPTLARASSCSGVELHRSRGQQAQGFSTSTTTSSVYTVNVPFAFGDPLLLTLFMFSGAGTIGICHDISGCPQTEGTAPFLASGVGASSADFFHTLVLSGLLPSVGGIPIGSAVFTADSGAHDTHGASCPSPQRWR